LLKLGVTLVNRNNTEYSQWHFLINTGKNFHQITCFIGQ